MATFPLKVSFGGACHEIYPRGQFGYGVSSWISMYVQIYGEKYRYLVYSCEYNNNEFLVALTFSFHTHGETLHVSTVLAAVSLPLVDHTVSLVSASIRQVLAHSPFEKSFTTFTTVI